MNRLKFYVPNNEEGQQFIKLLRKFKNRKEVKGFKVRGRGNNRREKMEAKKGYINNCRDIDIAEADYYAVYLVDNEKDLRFAEWQKGYDQGYADGKAAMPDMPIPKISMFLKTKRKFNFEEV